MFNAATQEQYESSVLYDTINKPDIYTILNNKPILD